MVHFFNGNLVYTKKEDKLYFFFKDLQTEAKNLLTAVSNQLSISSPETSSTCVNSRSSTLVSRPKIETIALKRPLS